MKEQRTQKDKPINTELNFEQILENLLKVKPPEKKKPVKKKESKPKTKNSKLLVK